MLPIYRVFLACLLLFLSADVASAQEKSDPFAKWETDIRRFEEADSKHPPKEGGVLFVGSSSVRQWDLARWFPYEKPLNRGFGGSEIADVIHFADRVVFKYKPRIIVFYSGDNDVARGNTAEQVAGDMKKFLGLVQKNLPTTHVVIIPPKPSLKRWNLWPVMNDASKRIRRLTASRHNWRYADITAPMLADDGKPRGELFVEDGLHLSEKGYELWTSILKRHLAGAEKARGLKLARGRVFVDADKNRRLDEGEQTLAGIRVSNGRDIVVTDDDGGYALPVDDDDILFVIKPRGFRTPLSKEKLPRFYYIHKPRGSPKSRFPGVAPTGPLPDSVDFPLYSQKEPERFQAILFGDPQPRDQKEVDYMARSVVPELLGTKASFGVTLGDITFDNLALFKPQAQAIALVGIPWYNVIGNHDVNLDAKHDHESDETFESVFGPAYYSFDYGPVHFLVLDDIQWYVEPQTGRGRYRGGFGPEQMEFIRNDLADVPQEKLVVLMMHIPLTDVHDRRELYRMIERRRFCMSISAHTHHHEHRYIDGKDGFRGPVPHHHVINVTVCGSWWSGSPDERGVPHSLMADGAPRGYSIISFDGNKYRLDFKAAGRPADYQMRIHAPDELALEDVASARVYANVFNGSEKSKVEMRFAGGKWTAMTKTFEADPHFREIYERDNNVIGKKWRDLPKPKPSPHLWRSTLPGDAPPGAHLLEVQTTDRHGRTYSAGRVIRVAGGGMSGAKEPLDAPDVE